MSHVFSQFHPQIISNYIVFHTSKSTAPFEYSKPNEGGGGGAHFRPLLVCFFFQKNRKLETSIWKQNWKERLQKDSNPLPVGYLAAAPPHLCTTSTTKDSATRILRTMVSFRNSTTELNNFFLKISLGKLEHPKWTIISVTSSYQNRIYTRFYFNLP